MSMSLRLELERDFGGKCPEFLAPVKHRLSISKLRKLETYEETIGLSFNETLEDKFKVLSGKKDIVVPNFELVIREWFMNARSHGTNCHLELYPDDKFMTFSASTEDMFYFGVRDPGQGFYLRGVLESGRYWEPRIPAMRGRGICEISREQLDWIYNINRAHDHTIIGIKKF